MSGLLRRLRAGLMLVLCVSLSGCSWLFSGNNCEMSPELAAAHQRPTIEVPEDLDGLDEDKAFKIPTATTPPAQASGECLDVPPKLDSSG